MSYDRANVRDVMYEGMVEGDMGFKKLRCVRGCFRFREQGVGTSHPDSGPPWVKSRMTYPV